MPRQTIRNRKGQRVVVLIEKALKQKGLAFVMHGLGAFKEQPHLEIIARAFRESGYTTVRFDATNAGGESDGKYEDATTTNYYEDLEDVINWAAAMPWYSEPFFLVGHSLGGLCVMTYAIRHSENVKAVAPIATVVSGKLSLESYSKKELQQWKKLGYKSWPSQAKPGITRRLRWSHMVDRLKYDLLKDAHKVRAPVLMIVGNKDTLVRISCQRMLYKALKSDKQFRIIKGADHDFSGKSQLKQLKTIFLGWIKSLDQKL